MAAPFLVTLLATAVPGQPRAGTSTEGGPPLPALRELAPGVRIDWSNAVVELDAKVVLREGTLELLACSPQTREHESILVVSARPVNVFQALGLIGLEPGSPARYDEERERWFEPTGEALEVRVRYANAGEERIVPAERWLRQVDGDRPVDKLPWVFAGSRKTSAGRFGADADGTVICVVDFDSALITVGSLHSADNDQLWLRANAKEIPPIGTACTLLVRSAHRPTVELDLVDEHTVRYKDQSLSAEQLAKMLRPPPDDARPGRLYIHPAATVSDEAAKAFAERVIKSGFEGVVETKRRP